MLAYMGLRFGAYDSGARLICLIPLLCMMDLICFRLRYLLASNLIFRSLDIPLRVSVACCLWLLLLLFLVGFCKVSCRLGVHPIDMKLQDGT